MKQRHLISLRDYTTEDVEEIFDLAARVKADPAAYAGVLQGKSLAMIFQKPSTRTRVSFEVGMFQLGGQALYLGADAIQLQRGESVADTAVVLSRFVDGIMARVYAHQDLLDLSRHATVPVINGLSDLLHPCQALADYFTLRERRGRLEGLKIAYVGDGNNVCHELMFGAVKLGMRMSVASPEGYAPNISSWHTLLPSPT
jgi:ornithine carbamoyltransferase